MSLPPAEPAPDAGLRLDGLTHRHRNTGGVEDVHLNVRPGETVAILGPSGAGKSTLVNLIAGVNTLQQGSIHLNGRDITRLAPGRRDVAAVLQDIPLYDHLDVRKNIELSMSSLDLSAAELEKRGDLALAAIEGRGLAGRRASQLSGGERARVAIARILARRPAAVLLDEPYAAVDTLFRVPLRQLVCNHLRRTDAAIIHVTHDVGEAIDVADRIAIMASGRILQVDVPERLREDPADPIVAALFPTDAG